MAHWEALPLRQLGEVLTRIDYRTERSESRGTRYTATFRHWDNRVWQAVIATRAEPVVYEGDRYTHTIELTSGGCRPVNFMATSFHSAERTVSRFANINPEIYNRIVADAKGTTDHPRSGDIGVFTMNVLRVEHTAFNRTETHRSVRNGIGRLEGEQLTIFPTSDELAQLLADVASSGVLAIVPRDINQLRDPEADRGFVLAGDRSARYTRDMVPTMTLAEVDEAVGRLFTETSDAAVAGLNTGDFCIATPHGREARAIDFREGT